MINRVAAIITVFYPDKEVSENVLSVTNQIEHAYVIDNTPNKSNFYLFAKYSNLTYIANKKNLGLSIAFNKCLKSNDLRNYDYIIFFDQDSIVRDGIIDALIKEYELLIIDGYKIGCIGPAYYEKNSKKVMIPKQKKELIKNCYSVKSIITSSMLTTYSNLEEINFWNEEIFLDMADWDLCWRFISSGFLCCFTQNIIINHKLGESVKHIGPFMIKEGVAIREYYQTRDCLKLLFKFYTPLKFRFRFVLMVTTRPLIHILILQEKFIRSKYILLGILDFFKHKNGVFPY